MLYYHRTNELAEIIQDIVKVGIRINISKAFYSLDDNDQVGYESAIYNLKRITGMDDDFLNDVVRRTHVKLKGESNEKS